MAKNLVIVESPAKAKTLGKYLGRNYIVKASVGHVVDLPKSKLGVDIENDFKPDYAVIHGKIEGHRRAQEGRKRQRKHLLGARPRSRGRGHRVAHRRAARQQKEHPSRPLQRDHEEGGSGGDQEAAEARPGQVRRAAGSARPRSARRLPAEPASVGQGPPRSLGRARAVGRRAPDHRARTRHPGLRQGRVLDDRRDARRATIRRRSMRNLFERRRQASRPQDLPARERGRGQGGRRPPARVRSGSSPRSRRATASATRRRPSSPRDCSRRRRASSATSRAARWASPRSFTRASRSATRARSVSSPTCVPTRPGFRPTPSRRCAATSARATAPTTFPRSRRSSSRRRTPQDAHEAIRPTSIEFPPERVAQYPREGRAQPLHAHLEPLRRLSDGAGAPQGDHHRHQRQGHDLPRDRPGRRLRRLHAGLHRGRRRRRR